MKRLICVLAVMMAPAYFAVALKASPDGGDKAKRKRVSSLMYRVHDGKGSPLDVVGAELKAKEPSWKVLEQNAGRFAEMAQALSDDKSIGSYLSSGYIGGADDLERAVKNKDANSARTAFKSLQGSCATCHRYGGIADPL